MNDYTKNIQFMDNMIARMKELGIDLYLIITGEGADPIPGTCFGVDTVGSSAYAFTSRGDKLAIASVIDAQDVEESGMFDKVIHYQEFYPALPAPTSSRRKISYASNTSGTTRMMSGSTSQP